MIKTSKMLQDHLKSQLKFIENSSSLYDQGNEEEAQRLAVSIRVIFHDTRNSTSLLKQMQIKNNIFLISSSSQYIPVNLVAYNGIVGMRSTGEYIPLCNMDDQSSNKWHLFEDWWNELIVNDNAYTFSRKDIVLMIANKDGGAHVDGEIDDGYANLAYNNSLGWMYSDGTQEYPFTNNAAYATVRQIAHEVLISLRHFEAIKSYTRKAHGEVDAVRLEKALYFVKAGSKEDPIASKLLIDPRAKSIERRKTYIDSLVFHDNNHSQRLIIN
jgi:hypothetical protein